ncbi:MAG: WbqC family protein [Prevotellaceae bacterium]|nr:WbqC family protein [Prevotellaceae bacterium]
MPEVYLSTAYLGNVQYFSKLANADLIHLEQCEHYQKQSYRNRCCIAGANGILTLAIPIEKDHGKKMPIRDVKIDYSQAWQQNHWRAILSTYNSSPFFEYYADDIRPFYEGKETFLFDFNLKLMEQMLERLSLSVNILYTTEYKAEVSYPQYDYRQSINPKKRLSKPDSLFNSQNYFQVFIQRYGFIPNLSIIDLLFNEGPGASQYLIL